MTGPVIYQAQQTGQMRLVGAASGCELRVHELRDDGEPRCGPKADSWKGQPMRLVTLGPRGVTCKSCARITGH